MFGAVVQQISTSNENSPLYHARDMIDELKVVNKYAGQFHHNTNPDSDSVIIKDAELSQYSSRTLKLIYKGC